MNARHYTEISLGSYSEQMCGRIIWILGVDLISWPISMFSFSVILLLQFISSAPGHFRSNPFPFKLYQRMNLVLESGMAWSRQNPHTDQNNFESVLARTLLGESVAVGVGVFLGRTKRRPRDLMQATDPLEILIYRGTVIFLLIPLQSIRVNCFWIMTLLDTWRKRDSPLQYCTLCIYLIHNYFPPARLGVFSGWQDESRGE